MRAKRHLNGANYKWLLTLDLSWSLQEHGGSTMSSEQWKVVYRTIRMVNRSIPQEGRRPSYGDTLMVAMYVWAVEHDRPMSWAAQRSNYTSMFRPRRLPSRSQFCRRIKSARCERLLEEVNARLARGQDASSGLRILDGRAFPVGRYTKDADAKIGYAPGGYLKGYKLHGLATEDGRFPHFRVTSLNESEKTLAKEIIEEARPKGILLADQGYESGPLYDFAMERGTLLFTPLFRNAGGGHRPQSEARLLAKRIWDSGGEVLYARRDAIERHFGQLSSFGGGLAPLPAWVRTLQRVRRWITAKIIIYHARLGLRKSVA